MTSAPTIDLQQQHSPDTAFLNRATLVWPIYFISQWMKRWKHGLFVFPPKKTLTWRRHHSIGQSCCSMTSKQSIDWFLEIKVLGHEIFSSERSLNQPKAMRVCFRSKNQSNRSISVRLLFLFCSRVFISRSYENRFYIIEELIIILCCRYKISEPRLNIFWFFFALISFS